MKPTRPPTDDEKPPQTPAQAAKEARRARVLQALADFTRGLLLLPPNRPQRWGKTLFRRFRND